MTGEALQFYSAVNRHLLQVNVTKSNININSVAYDDSKKIFNIWLFLFLKGLNGLIEPVEKRYKNYEGSNPTVFYKIL